MSLFKKIAPNLNGRDFVVGDLHGCFTLLEQAMWRANFDATVDRVISVGDLIDRGSESVRCLEFLQQPWFHAVRGNHEEALINYVISRGEGSCQSLEEFYGNNAEHMIVGYGQTWIETTPFDIISRIAEEFKKLPYAIEVESPVGLIGFVHADIPFFKTWQQVRSEIERRNPRILDYVTGSRKRHNNKHRDGVQGLHRLYVGHQYVEDVRFLGNVCFVDTGAVGAEMGYEGLGYITFADITASAEQFHLNRDKNFNIVLADGAPRAARLAQHLTDQNYTPS